MERIIKDIIRGVSNTYGQAFFEQICLALSGAIQADYTFIAKLDKHRNEAQTLALVADNQIVDNITYSLKGTPCAGVLDTTTCCYPTKVCSAFPEDQLLVDMQITGYLGTAIHASDGQVMGIVVALYKHPIAAPDTTQTLFELFSGRISGEMERLEFQQKLQGLNATLERRVDERTNALQEAINNLQQTQERLIESEKMAALGSLVAGLAHEVNTPLGVSITSASVVNDSLKSFWPALRSGKLKRSDVDQVEQRCTEALGLLGNNLTRARDLVASFKQTAASKQELKMEEVDLVQYYRNILHLLWPRIQQKNIDVEFNGQVERPVLTFPAAHAQILTHLINNSMTHAFSHKHGSAKIIIQLREEQGMLLLDYCDNGRGLSNRERQHLFEPFFTTDRKAGSTGLGMSILFNLVTQKLAGQVRLKDTDTGFAMEIQLPLDLATIANAS